MIVWCIILIALGVFGILQDTGLIISLGAPYRLGTWIIMLIALGILVRIRYKEKTAEKEKLRARVEELEKRLKEMEQHT